MDSSSTITSDDNQVEETAFDLALMEVFGPEKPNLDSPLRSRGFFNFVQNLLNDLAVVVDEVLQVPPTENSSTHTLRLTINAPVFELIRQIVSEIKVCGVGSEEKTMAILNMLEGYSLKAKATLTLAAFAVEFGDFCLFAKIEHLVNLSYLGPFKNLGTFKKLATLKGVPIFVNSSELLKRRVIIHEIKEIIDAVLQVMNAIFEVETRFEKENLYEIVQDLHGQLPEPLQMDEVLYLIITTVVACAIEVSNLTSDKEAGESLNLSSNLKKFQEVFNTLEEQRMILRKEGARIQKYNIIKALFDIPTVEILKTMFFRKDEQLELIDVSASHDKVQSDVLRGKNVCLFISSLDNISEIEISALKLVYKETKKDNNYKIVWIPMVEQQWSDELRNKFETILSSSNEMFGYVLPLFSQPIPGLRHIKKNWKLNDKPILVVMSSEGNVYHKNALPSIREHGMRCFRNEVPIIFTTCGYKEDLVNEKKYIFLYGGKDNKSIQKFGKVATALASDPFIKENRIDITHFYVTDEEEKSSTLFLSRKGKKQVSPVIKEIEKLRSDKNSSGWALLGKSSTDPSSTVVISGDINMFLRVLEEFEKWSEYLSYEKKSFGTVFKDYAKTCKK